MPGGRVLVDLERHPGRLVEVMGVIGFIARGIAFALVGFHCLGVYLLTRAWRLCR